MKFNLKPNFGVLKMLWTFKLSSRSPIDLITLTWSQNRVRMTIVVGTDPFFAEELTSVEFVHLSHVALIPRRDS